MIYFILKRKNKQQGNLKSISWILIQISAAWIFAHPQELGLALRVSMLKAFTYTREETCSSQSLQVSLRVKQAYTNISDWNSAARY